MFVVRTQNYKIAQWKSNHAVRFDEIPERVGEFECTACPAKQTNLRFHA